MRRKTENSNKALLLLAVLLLILGITVVFLYVNTRTDEIAALRSEQHYIPVLFSVHEGDEHLFSELFIYHPLTGKGAFFDIPGELGLMIPSLKRIDRIETIFDPEHPDEFRNAVAKMMAVDIPYHIILSYEDLEGVVDLMGGVDLFIANPVEYMENDQIVLLPSGSVRLDGAKAALYGTYHDPDESDIERINRRQRLAQAFFGRMGEEASLLMEGSAEKLLHKRISTNLNRRAFSSYLESLTLFDADRVVFQRILGTIRNVDGKELLFPHYEGKVVREAVEQTLVSIASEEILSNEELTLSLEILNGTSRNGLAGRTSTVFKGFGYEVVGIGNAPETEVEKSYVVDHTGDITKAQRVANLIRCKDVRSASETSLASTTDSDVLIDVTIVLGKDFDGRYCKEE
ncbi:LCP family protein [Sediminispirochaeta bajacaliforniensis]|uniref:LCP family protein n=1 Tax=Sediminispirochaeta bajacaliforniensis TaxID=148 RepID=UPI000377A9C7|nr:LCP family protein [Sediminispirochaeta bajacaliforniensis]